MDVIGGSSGSDRIAISDRTKSALSMLDAMIDRSKRSTQTCLTILGPDKSAEVFRTPVSSFEKVASRQELNLLLPMSLQSIATGDRKQAVAKFDIESPTDSLVKRAHLDDSTTSQRKRVRRKSVSNTNSQPKISKPKATISTSAGTRGSSKTGSKPATVGKFGLKSSSKPTPTNKSTVIDNLRPGQFRAREFQTPTRFDFGFSSHSRTSNFPF